MSKYIYVFLFLSFIINAQPEDNLIKIKGKSSVSLENGNIELTGYNKTNIEKSFNNVKYLSNIFENCEEFKNPIGVDLEIISQYKNNQYENNKFSNEPLAFNITLFIYKYIKDENGEIYSNTSDGAYLSVDINSLAGNFSGQTMLSFNGPGNSEEYLPEYKNGDFLYEPKVIDKYLGYNIYDNGTIVITKDDIPLFVPVTVEEYLTGLIKYNKYEIEKTNKYMEENITNLPQKIKDEEVERNRAFKQSYEQLLQIDRIEAEKFKKEYIIAEKEIKKAAEQSIKDTAEYRKGLTNETNMRNEIVKKLEEELNSYSEEGKKLQAFIGDVCGYDSSFLTNKDSGRGLVKINIKIFEHEYSVDKIRLIILRTYPIAVNNILNKPYDKHSTELSYLHKFVYKLNKSVIMDLLK